MITKKTVNVGQSWRFKNAKRKSRCCGGASLTARSKLDKLRQHDDVCWCNHRERTLIGSLSGVRGKWEAFITTIFAEEENQACWRRGQDAAGKDDGAQRGDAGKRECFHNFEANI
jgi:hypothetical protein